MECFNVLAFLRVNPDDAAGLKHTGTSFDGLAPYTYQTSTYTVTNSDYYIDTNGTFDVTLPTAAGIQGRSFIIKNSGTGVITIQTTSSELIDNLPSFNLAFYDTVTIESNGSDWLVTNPQTKQFIRVYNNTGSIIPKGTALNIVSATSGIPDVSLPIASNHTGNCQVIGLAYIDIPVASEGIAISSGILSALNLSAYSVGDVVYLSDTVAGGLILPTAFSSFNVRSNRIGYVTSNSSTLGTLQIDIQNEDAALSLTDIERNILEGNVISTGVYDFSPGLTKITSTTFSISPAKGWIVNNTGAYATSPDVTNIIYAGATGQTTPYIATADSTYILLDATGTIIKQATFPTPVQRRDNIFLGKVVHPDRTTILNVNNTVDFDVSPVSMIRDLWTPIKLINQGIVIQPNGTNLSVNNTGGTLWGNGINWVVDQKNPDSVNITSQTPFTFQYRTQSGSQAGFTNRTTLEPDYYDVAGTRTNITGSGAKSTNQRVYLFPTGLIRIQYGQTVYADLTKAVTGLLTEVFNEYVNNRDNGQLIGVISLRSDATDLSDPNDAIFHSVSKFGELLGGAAGGISTTNLQQAYDNSSSPEILTNSTLGAVSFKRGSTADTDNVIEVQDGSSNVNFAVTGQGIVYNNADSQTGLTTGTSTVTSFAKAGGVCAYIEYYIKNSSNSAIRAGVLIATWDGTNITFTDSSTPDLNNPTTAIKLDATISGADVLIRAIITSGTWDVKVGVRIIF